MTTTLDVDSVIERLLSVRGQPNNRTVQLAEGEIRALCAAARCVREDASTRGVEIAREFTRMVEIVEVSWSREGRADRARAWWMV